MTAEQVKLRDNKLTGSRVGILMSGDEGKILSLWKEMLGLEPEPDLSGVWPVRLGEATENLNLDWYGEKRGIEVTRRGEVVIHKNHFWMAATLDGWDSARNCPIECKHCGGRESLETIIARYMPQVTWQMLVTDTLECALSVIQAADAPVVEYIKLDLDYAQELMTRARAFMLCIETLTPPVALPAVEPPALPVKEYDMSDNAEWTSLAARYLQVYGADVTCREVGQAIKRMVPQDAKKAFGGGIVVTRNRAGAMSLREMRE